MAKYRKIDPRIWNDEKFYSASLSCQHLFLFVLTHPHMTPVGAMRISKTGLADELDWTAKGFPEGFAEAFEEGYQHGFWKYDERAKFLLVPKFMKYNPPDNPNVLKAWAACWGDLPECELKSTLYDTLKGLAEGLGEAFAKGFAEGYAKTGAGAGTGKGLKKDAAPPPNIWDAGTALGLPRALIGKWNKQHGEEKTAACIAHLSVKRPADPVQYGTAWLQERPAKLFVPKDDGVLVAWAKEHNLPDAGKTETYQEYRQRLWSLVKERAA